MSFKLRTSKKSEEIISRLEASENLPCYTLVKLAIALSLRSKATLSDKDLSTNTLGRELNRQTITGDADALYKCLIEVDMQRHITDDEFFPTLIKAHLDRGMVMLDQEQRYAGDFLTHLAELDKAL